MSVIVVDAHVHIHACFSLGAFLDAAYANFRAHAPAGEPFAGVLLLTESAQDDAFGRLAECAAGGPPPPDARGWRFAPAGELVSIRATAPDGRELIVVAGRQVAAAEDLEVLFLATPARPPDGLPIRRLLEIADEVQALRVVPWGAGKWFFARGKLLSEILRAAPPGRFFLGDESARPALWPTPRHFDEARGYGIRVLRGSDPLPFPREVTRAGSYGFSLDAAGPDLAPAASLSRTLSDPSARIVDFGVRERPLAFVRNQIAMQLRKRTRRGAGARAQG